MRPRKIIKEYIQANGPTDADTLKAQITNDGFRLQRAERVLQNLEEKGLIVKNGNDYSLPA